MKKTTKFSSSLDDVSNDDATKKSNVSERLTSDSAISKKEKQKRSPIAKAKYHTNKIFEPQIGRKQASKSGNISSYGSLRTYVSSISVMFKTLDFGEIPKPKTINHDFAIKYLEFRSTRVKQKTLDADRLALSKVFDLNLPNMSSVLETNLTSRVYSESQVGLILQDLEPKIATPIQLCFVAGLRAHELLTILPLEERSISPNRDWWNQQFDGMPDGKIYSVIGKGGLVRPVKIPLDLVVPLESLRLNASLSKKDRGIFYKCAYQLLAGQNLSQFFSARSEKVLGWTLGLHGLRHSYAQNRMRTLLSLGYSFSVSLGIVSRELGHYRPEITSTYLR